MFSSPNEEIEYKNVKTDRDVHSDSTYRRHFNTRLGNFQRQGIGLNLSLSTNDRSMVIISTWIVITHRRAYAMLTSELRGSIIEFFLHLDFSICKLLWLSSLKSTRSTFKRLDFIEGTNSDTMLILWWCLLTTGKHQICCLPNHRQ